MNFDNPRVKSIIYRSLCLVIMAAGCHTDKPTPKAPILSQDDQYRQQMKTLSEGFAGLESNAQLAMQSSATPDELLTKLRAVFDKKSEYIRSLRVLDAPEKYKELHLALLEWREKEHENEGQLLEAFALYRQDKSKATEAKIEKLTKANDEIGKKYEFKTLDIAMKHGFDSVEKFMAGKASSK